MGPNRKNTEGEVKGTGPDNFIDRCACSLPGDSTGPVTIREGRGFGFGPRAQSRAIVVWLTA